MSTELLTEPEILALLTQEFPPDKGYPWRQYTYDGYCSVVHGREMDCYKGICANDKGVQYFTRNNIKGAGPTIPAAIADFRAKVAAEAAALGALKAGPNSDYNNVETAIYAAAFAEGIIAGMRCEYRDMGKEEWVAMSVASAKEAVALHRAAIK